MQISISNFKSIKQLDNFEIKPFTVLSGVNSSGKSSFIQLLLLLKQTIELDSSKKLLDLDGDFYKVSEYKDILYNQDYKNKLKISFKFNSSESFWIKSPKILNFFKNYQDYQVLIEIEYDFEEEIIISSSVFNVIVPELEKSEQSIEFKTLGKDGPKYSINTTNAIYGKDLYNPINPPKITRISYSGIYPVNYEIVQEIEKEGFESEYITELQTPIIDDFKQLVTSFFNSISYIGPLREQPKDEYSIARNHQYVGAKGEFVAQVLEKYAKDPITHHKISLDKEGGIKYKLNDSTLLEAVRFWICDIFKIAKDIYAEKVNENYKIVLVGESNLTTTIKHVGFGISQLLPIIVEGLRLPIGGTLILEQPEIHLHPKYQSLLFDFLYGLTLQGKKIIIETHSDHLITRMRRRVAEDTSNELQKYINLTFIENIVDENIFRTLDLDEFGTLDYFPKDFIESPNDELRAILKAQMRKRTKK